MQGLSLCALFLVTNVAVAQCASTFSLSTEPPINTSFFFTPAATPSPDPGPMTLWDVTATAPVTLTGIDVRLQDQGGFLSFPNQVGNTGPVTLWFTAGGHNGLHTAPGVWTAIGTGTLTVAPVSALSPIVLAAPIALPAGFYGLALQFHPTTAGPQPTGRVHPCFVGQPPSVSDQFLTLQNQVVQDTAFTTPTVTGPFAACQRMHYSVGPSTALSVPVGSGCYQRHVSFGETFINNTAGPTVDLSNQAFELQPRLGTHYELRPIAPAIVPPASAPLTQAQMSAPIALPFPLTVVGTIPGGSTFTSIYVSRSGAVYLWQPYSSPSNGIVGTRQHFELNVPHFAVASNLWAQAPFGTGTVHYDVDPGNTSVRITWNRFLYQVQQVTQSQLDAQLVLHADGRAEFHYGTFFEIWNTVTVGYTLGLGQPSESTDLSIGGAIVPYVSGDGFAPAVFSADARPVLGTTFTVRTSGMRPGTAFDLIVLSLTGGTPVLLDPLGMPGCVAWVGPDVLTSFALGAGTHAFPIALPPVAAYAGLPVFGQSVQFTPGWNTAGLLVSNGLCLQLGF